MDYFKSYQKKNRWVYALSLILQLVAIPVSLWIEIRYLKTSYGLDSRELGWNGSDYGTILLKEHVNQNLILLFVILLLAILSAYRGFSYLHTKEKVNCSKRNVFATSFITSILFYVIPLLISIVVSSFVAVVYNCFHYQLILGYCLNGIMYLLYYLLVYFLISITILLTGTFGTSVLYFLFLCFMESMLSSTSFYDYIRQNALIGSVIVCGVTVILAWISYVLLVKRPEIEEHTAFAFPLAQKITKYVLVICLVLYLASYLILLSGGSNLVVIPGLIASCWLFNFVADCAFSIEWKKAIKNWQDFVMISGIVVLLFSFLS